MRFPLWRLTEGPEWGESVRETDPGDAWFERNLEAARQALELDPYTYSRPFLGDRDEQRVFTTRDVAAGYRVVLFFRVWPPKRTCELGWVEVEALEE